MLNKNCGTSLFVLCLLHSVWDKSLKPVVVGKCLNMFKAVAQQAITHASHHQGGLHIDLGAGNEGIVLLPNGMVSGFHKAIGAVHKNILKGWILHWNSMVGNGLTTECSDHEADVSFMDLVIFVFSAKKARRSLQKAAWSGKSLDTLKMLQHRLLCFLQCIVDEAVVGYLEGTDAYNIPVPSRVVSRPFVLQNRGWLTIIQ